MAYMGSKAHLAKFILPIINPHIDEVFIEPFCGMCGILKHFKGVRIAFDTHPYLIALLKSLQKGWIPPEKITASNYLDVKNNKTDFSDHLVGYVGFICSYRNKWFSGYSGDYIDNRNDKCYDRANSGREGCIILGKMIHNVHFECKSYEDIKTGNNSIIYCDPPYRDTTRYGGQRFDSDKFWDWCRDEVIKGNRVFVSEYTAPNDFILIWEKQKIKSTFNGKHPSDKLFIHESQVV